MTRLDQGATAARRVRSLRSNPLLIQVVTFGFTGVAASIVNISIYWAGTQRLRLDPNLAWFIGFIGAAIVGYALQSRFVFAASQQSKVTSGSRFVAVALVGLAFNSFWVWSLVSVLHLPTWAPIPLILLATPVITFCLNRFWVFR
jgi:putative flippase GtrA